jgi:hypothetical protein
VKIETDPLFSKIINDGVMDLSGCGRGMEVWKNRVREQLFLIFATVNIDLTIYLYIKTDSTRSQTIKTGSESISC